MIKKFNRYIEERSKENWGMQWHFQICFLYVFGLIGVMSGLESNTRVALLIFFLSFSLFVMFIYEKNQYIKNEDKKAALIDLIEDVVFNFYGFFVGYCAGVGFFL